MVEDVMNRQAKHMYYYQWSSMVEHRRYRVRLRVYCYTLSSTGRKSGLIYNISRWRYRYFSSRREEPTIAECVINVDVDNETEESMRDTPPPFNYSPKLIVCITTSASNITVMELCPLDSLNRHAVERAHKL